MPRRVPEPLGIAIGARIRACRKQLSLTLEGLADEIAKRDAEGEARLTKSRLSDVERGVYRIEVHTLARIADGLGVRLFELTTFPDQDARDAAALAASAMALRSVPRRGRRTS